MPSPSSTAAPSSSTLTDASGTSRRSEALPSYHSLPPDLDGQGSLSQPAGSFLPSLAPAEEERNSCGFPRDVKAAYVPAPPARSPSPPSSSTSLGDLPARSSPVQVEQADDPPVPAPDEPCSSLGPAASSYLVGRSAFRPTPSSISLRTLLSVPALAPAGAFAALASTTIRKSHLRRVGVGEGTMRTLGTERFYTAHGEGTWAGGRREGVTASVAEGVVLGGGTDVLLRYFEEMELADEHPTLDTLRALAREPSFASVPPPDLPPPPSASSVPADLKAFLWAHIAFPSQPLDGALISYEYCASVYAGVLDWLYRPPTGKAGAPLFVDES